jgi:hypothetical protein
VPGQEGLLPVAADGPGHDARAQRVEGTEAVRRADQAVTDFSWGRFDETVLATILRSNPTIVNYNASVVNIYITTNSIGVLE